jgi:phage-related protein
MSGGSDLSSIDTYGWFGRNTKRFGDLTIRKINYNIDVIIDLKHFMDDWSVEFYALDNGTSPLYEWFIVQSSRTQAKFLRTFKLLEEFGIDVGMPHVKPLANKLYEIRVKVDGNNFRIIYFAYTGRKFIMLHGFHKKTPKTPERDMEIAEKYMEYFLLKSQSDIN